MRLRKMEIIPKIFFLYGNTCSGQSTLGMKLEAELGFNYISFGDLKRIEITNGTDIGEELKCRIKNGEPIRIVVIDSLTAHFRAEFAGRGQLADRQQKLNKYLHRLMQMAEQFNLAVYVTNQVMANPAMMFGDPTTAIGGNIVGHASTYRIYIRRGKKGSRVAKLIDSPNLPDNECIFWVGGAGVNDEEDK